jgi:hypothetical protein
MQMLLADVVERTDNATLENGEIVFSAIDVNEATEAYIFIGGVVDGSMACIFIAEL